MGDRASFTAEEVIDEQDEESDDGYLNIEFDNGWMTGIRGMFRKGMIQLWVQLWDLAIQMFQSMV